VFVRREHAAQRKINYYDLTKALSRAPAHTEEHASSSPASILRQINWLPKRIGQLHVDKFIERLGAEDFNCQA